MSAWPQAAIPPLTSVHPWSLESCGAPLGILTSSLKDSGISTAWPSANLAIYVPFRIYTPTTFAIGYTRNGGTATGNLDIGIYSEDGVRLVSMGSTAQSGTSTLQTLNITDITLQPGLYYMAMAADSGSTTIAMGNAWTAPMQLQLGCYQQATAFPLPTVATFASLATFTRMPNFGFSMKATI